MSDNLPAKTEVRGDVLLQRALDPAFIFDDLAKEGAFRGVEAIKNMSLEPLWRRDPAMYPVTTFGGDLVGKALSKIHKLFDDGSSHGPTKGTKVVHRTWDDEQQARKKGRRRGSKQRKEND
jgi:hypothetical protein